VLQIVGLEVGHTHGRHEKRSVREKVIHLLQRTLGSFWQESPEEKRIGSVADAEDNIPFL